MSPIDAELVLEREFQDRSMDEATRERPGETRDEAAAYVADLTADLARIARGHGLDVLGYLLDMARLEARNIATRMDGKDAAVN
jgi:hypothetical protein